MNRLLLTGLLSLSLTACATPPKPVVETVLSGDLPDAALVAPCDTSDAPWRLNIELLDGWLKRGEQRDACAAQVAKLANWRAEAVARLNEQLQANTRTPE